MKTPLTNKTTTSINFKQKHSLDWTRSAMLAAGLLLTANTVWAQHNGLGAHVHGIAEIDLIQDGKDLYVEFHSPAMNLVGFEHKPSSAADHQAVDKATATLRDGQHIFTLPNAASCKQKSVQIASKLLEKGTHNEEHEGHAEHDHGHDEHHAHEHQHEHHEEHAEHEKHHEHDTHEGHEEGEAHSEFQATYTFHCESPAALDAIGVNLFAKFPGTHQINASSVTPSGQHSQRLNAQSATLQLKH